TLTIKSNLHQEQLDFENSDAFREKSRMRYRIEQKNSELKNRYGLKKSMSNGLFGMTIQSASTVFIANMRKIIREIEKKGA
ncbi:Transposase DDE domain-containing protein, partial [Trichococcus flocculiformis]